MFRIRRSHCIVARQLFLLGFIFFFILTHLVIFNILFFIFLPLLFSLFQIDVDLGWNFQQNQWRRGRLVRHRPVHGHKGVKGCTILLTLYQTCMQRLAFENFVFPCWCFPSFLLALKQGPFLGISLLLFLNEISLPLSLLLHVLKLLKASLLNYSRPRAH